MIVSQTLEQQMKDMAFSSTAKQKPNGTKLPSNKTQYEKSHITFHIIHHISVYTND